MNTKKMISDINSAINDLVTEKTSLLDQIKSMAIESLELTITQKDEPVSEKQAEKTADSARYTRKTMIEFAGRKQRLSAWAKEYHIHPDTLKYRLNAGVELKNALSVDVKCGKRIAKSSPKKVFAYDEHHNVIRQYVGPGDAARDLKIPQNVVEKMLSDVSIADQLASRSFYLAYAS